MGKFPHLRNAPIAEALLDFRVNPRPGFTAEVFASLKDELSPAYPIREPKKLLHGEINFGAGFIEQRTRDQGLHAYWFLREDRKRIAQFRLDGFTYNVLRPYESWDDMVHEALRLWELYHAIAQPARINRIATRFINHLDFPADDDLSDFLFGIPEIPPGLQNGVLSGFRNQMVIQCRHGIVSNINLSFIGAEKQSVKLHLDIDSFRAPEEFTDSLRDSEIRPILERLHHVKNSLFFGFLKDKGVNLYK